LPPKRRAVADFEGDSRGRPAGDVPREAQVRDLAARALLDQPLRLLELAPDRGLALLCRLDPAARRDLRLEPAQLLPPAVLVEEAGAARSRDVIDGGAADHRVLEIAQLFGQPRRRAQQRRAEGDVSRRQIGVAVVDQGTSSER
jgi:hypothetical protein